jgi:hypothetical protein
MKAASIPRRAPAGRPFAAELATARGEQVHAAAVAATADAARRPPVTVAVDGPVLPEPAEARPAGVDEREWRAAVRARVVDEDVAVSLPTALAVITTAWVALYVAAIAGIPGMGWAAYCGGLIALGLAPWLVWRVAAGKPAVRIPRRDTGEPAYDQLVADDAPRRWRRHADAHPPAADAVQYATRAVRLPAGGVRLEVLAYEPIGRWQALTDEADEWRPSVSREGERFWRMRVVEHVAVADEDADALADGLARLELLARRREDADARGRAQDRAHALAAHERDRERAAAERGLVSGANGWTRRR